MKLFTPFLAICAAFTSTVSANSHEQPLSTPNSLPLPVNITLEAPQGYITFLDGHVLARKTVEPTIWNIYEIEGLGTFVKAVDVLERNIHWAGGGTPMKVGAGSWTTYQVKVLEDDRLVFWTPGYGKAQANCLNFLDSGMGSLEEGNACLGLWWKKA